MKKLVVLAASLAGVAAWRSRRRRSAAQDTAVWHEAVTGPTGAADPLSRPGAGAPKAP